jgi:hypothetical protein
VAKIAGKAKVPALAGGAALVGLAGGAILGKRNQKRGVLDRIPKPDLSKLSAPDIKKAPKPGAVAKAVGDAAGKVAERSRQVGQVADDVRRASDAVGGKSR